MSQPTQYSNALAFQESIIVAATQLNSLLAFAQQIQSAQTSHNYAANLQAMPTYTPDTAGNPPVTTGEGGVTTITPDAAPNQANPMIGLNVSFYNLDQGRINLINDFATFMTGGAAPTLDRRPTVAALLP